ncbi:MAG: hypothetical protein AB7V55_05955 [Oscillospiraceae bacterium]
MARKPLPAATGAEEMLGVIPGEGRALAVALHHWAQRQGCAVQARSGPVYHRIQYFSSSPRRSLFTIICNAQRWRVKADLHHLAQYSAVAERACTAVKQALISTRSCNLCNSRCVGGSQFKLDGVAYCTCNGAGHSFEHLAEGDLGDLEALLAQELAVVSGGRAP